MSEVIYMMVLSYRFSKEYWTLDSYRRSNILKAAGRIINDPENQLIHIKTYRGIRHDCDLILWMSAYKPEVLSDIRMKVNNSLGGYGTTNYGMLSLYEHSPYMAEGGDLADTLRQEPRPYFVAYPMSKDPEWYLLDYGERKDIMAKHIGMAASSPESRNIRSYTTYSHGLGDQEFVVLYEVDSLADWSHVTAKLREAKARKWIVKETPILTGFHVDIEAI